MEPASTTNGGLARVVEIVAAVAGLLGYVYAIGWVVTWTRFTAARLPAGVATTALRPATVFAAGLGTTVVTGIVFAAASAIAYGASGRKWDKHGQDWHDLVRERGVANARATRPAHPEAAEAPLGDRAVRVVAGFNIALLSALVALAPARLAEEPFGHGWAPFAIVWLIAYFVARHLLTEWSPLVFGPRLHGLVWALVAAGALFASAPIGVLVLTGVALATAGRAVARLPGPRTVGERLRSPLPWILLTILTLVGLADHAIPPVSFPGVTIHTASGQLVGGYLTRTGAGVYVVTCTPLADATSTDERLRFVADREITSTAIGARASLDSGERPSLAAIAFRLLGVNGHPPTLFSADLRARRGTCAGAKPSRLSSGAYEDPALGDGVIAGPPPAGGRAHDGERPIEVSSPRIARLARQYAPTLLVTVADLNWPVSVGALLAERGSDRQPTCLIQARMPHAVCAPQLIARSLSGPGSAAGDYLQYPVRLKRTKRALPAGLEADASPTGQFEPFERGQYGLEPGQPITTSRLHGWLADPGSLDPWYSAQIYFYDAGPVVPSSWPHVKDRNVAGTYYALEYWFFYPYNYYPVVSAAALMNEAPLRADELDIDLHQGDWEHVAVLLDASLKPAWLYLARHSEEAQFVPWTNPALSFDGGHPIVQAAFGGHPSYEPGCGPRSRPITKGLSSDWLVCGSGRFAFRGDSTPLVDLARTPWACWPGHFGEAVPGIELPSSTREDVIDKARHQVYVAGPQSPLVQGENQGVACTGSPPRPRPVPLPR